MRKILESELSRLMSISVKYGDSLRKESMNYDEEYAKEVKEWRTSLELLSKEGTRLAERSKKMKIAGKLIGKPIRGDWLPKWKASDIVRDYIDIQNKHLNKETE